MQRALCAICASLVISACAAPATDTVMTKRACEPVPTQLVKQDAEPGTGEPITTGTAVLVGYTGWLYDGCKADRKGTMFDTSTKRATPFGFMVGAGRVIRGWDEGLVGMREGGKRTLLIPADKGYGEKGTPDGTIPPNSALVFEVELIKIITRPVAPAKP
jgi:FKBP-type peptidyl-prolyl cis-trans isomerase